MLRRSYCSKTFDSIGLRYQRPGGGMAYAGDLKSPVLYGTCGFDPHPGHVQLWIEKIEFIRQWMRASPTFPTARRCARNLRVISNNCGTGDGELGILFKNRQIGHVVAAFPGPGATYFQQQFDAGDIDLELVPQGILCERMRAYGAGIPAFYSPVGVGTDVAKGKEERVIRGKRYILKQSIGANYAFIKAHRADRLGNLVYRKGARNFNPVMATAARTTLVEVEEIVEVGSLDPEVIITPFIFVHRIIAVKG